MIHWKVRVENYGRIKQAEVEVSPFLAFVGDNNSGKSYLLSLIWGILTTGKRKLFHNANILQTSEWQECKKWLEDAYNAEHNVVLDIKAHLPLLNTILKQLVEYNKDSFIKDLFNYEGNRKTGD